MRLSFPSLALAVLIGLTQDHAHVAAAENKTLIDGYDYSKNWCKEMKEIDGEQEVVAWCDDCVFVEDEDKINCNEGWEPCESFLPSERCEEIKTMSRMEILQGVRALEELDIRRLQPETCYAESAHTLSAAGNCNPAVLTAMENNFLATLQFVVLISACTTCDCVPTVTSATATDFTDPVRGIDFCDYVVVGDCDGVCLGGGGGGAGGDPHFHTIHDEYFGYHGICDLVMVKSDKFGSGKGLDLHIRTEEQEGYSSISNAALRIGNDVLEVAKDGSYIMNGERAVELPTTIAGYPVSMEAGTNTDMFFADVSHGFTEAELNESLVFYIDLGEGDNIEIQVWRGYLWVNANLNHAELDDSTGLLGTWGKHGKIGRDGVTNIEDADAFGQEWQVLESEPKLFQVLRAPQHPDSCMPTTSIGRRLGSAKLAADACAHVEGPKKQFCMFDVSVTGDAKMGTAPFYK